MGIRPDHDGHSWQNPATPDTYLQGQAKHRFRSRWQNINHLFSTDAHNNDDPVRQSGQVAPRSKRDWSASPVGIGLPRQSTFRRHNSEKRDQARDFCKAEEMTRHCQSRVDPTDAEYESSIRAELDTQWILNLSMHFREKSDREKFFVTYAETPNKWRRVTVSCDYRNAEPGSLEMGLRNLQFRRDKHLQIYESIRDSLPEIQFYDTVTNLKLETNEGRLHVYVTEDANETLPDYSESLAGSAWRTTSQTRSYLPVISGGTDVMALPDSGARRNIMSLEYALQRGLKIDTSYSKRHAFKNAVGIQFQAIGETSIPIAFPDDPLNILQVVFSVVKKCSAPLIFGTSFLEATACLSTFKHRLIKSARGLAKRVFRVMQMECPGHRLQCLLGWEYALAVADTGSDIDLVSLEYAISRGWTIDRGHAERGRVILSDGTVLDLEGSIDIPFTLGKGTSTRHFYVLKNLDCDVLLGDSTLDELDVWNQHMNAFIEVANTPEWEFYNIEWVERFNEVEKEIDALIKGKTLPQHGGRHTFMANLFRPRNGARRGKGDEIKSGIKQRLYEIDTIEAYHARLMKIQIETATGDERRDKELEDEQRKRRWKDLRRRITELLETVGPNGTVPDASPV